MSRNGLGVFLLLTFSILCSCRSTEPAGASSGKVVEIRVARQGLFVAGQKLSLAEMAADTFWDTLPPAPRSFAVRVATDVPAGVLYRVERVLSGRMSDGDSYQLSAITPPRPVD